MNHKKGVYVIAVTAALLISGPVTHHLMGDYCLGEGCNIWIDFLQYSLFWTIVVAGILAIYTVYRRQIRPRISQKNEA